MYKERSIGVNCPQCHYTADMQIWEQIDAGLRPDLKKKLLNGELFTWTCPRCREKVRTPYGFLYMDMKRHLMFFFDPDAAARNSDEPAVMAESAAMGDYTVRTVYGEDALKEKIRMSDSGLDDIALERLKFMYSHQVDPEIGRKGWEMRFLALEAPDPDYEFGLLLFGVTDKSKKHFNRVYISKERYYEHLLACRLDPRMHYGQGECVDQPAIEKKMQPVGKKLSKDVPARDTDGVCSSRGIVLFPQIFERLHPVKEEKGTYYAEYEGNPYFITSDGGLVDPSGAALPVTKGVIKEMFMQKFIDWTLPGLQFFYRDTDALQDAEKYYTLGENLHACMFLDVTTKLFRPAHRTRYIIASAHAATLYAVDELTRKNPAIKAWNLCTLHYDSYFKVMDIYRVGAVTQIFLLHIPRSAALLFSHSLLEFIGRNFNLDLKKKARNSLDEKMQLPVHPRSLDPAFVKRMSHPVGLDRHHRHLSMEPVDKSAQEKGTVLMGELITRMTHCEDIGGYTGVNDHFWFYGVKGTVCQDCIYSRGADLKHDSCRFLSKTEFRKRFLRGRCEHRRTSGQDPAESETES